MKLIDIGPPSPTFMNNRWQVWFDIKEEADQIWHTKSIDMYDWLKENCVGEYNVYRFSYTFEHHEDAMMFYLAFTS